MDSRHAAQRLADRTGLRPAEAGKMMEALGAAIAGICADLDTVAIPGFGNFYAAKHDECVTADPVTGRRMLVPPAIEAGFKTSVVLRNRLKR